MLDNNFLSEELVKLLEKIYIQTKTFSAQKVITKLIMQVYNLQFKV